MSNKKIAAKASSPASRKYWLFKSEPSAFSIDNLFDAKGQRSLWDGVRNYQARNYLRDSVQVGDEVLFYHSREEPLGVFGTMRVTRTGIPDLTALDPKSCYYDPKSSPDNPRWYVVEVELIERFETPVLRNQLAENGLTESMLVMKRGMRLSIQPVTPSEWKGVLKLARSES